MAAPAGFCTIEVGDITVTFVPDGAIHESPTSFYPGSTNTLWRAHEDHLDENGLLVMSLGALLVASGDTLTLVDLGWGPSSIAFGGGGHIGGGALLENLARLKVQPAEIDLVLFSHLHRDHTGWIIDPDSEAPGEDREAGVQFPNAEHLVSKQEWEYWSSAELNGPAPSAAQLEVLATRLSFFDATTCLPPGIDVVATPGHTPGHRSFVLSSGKERAFVLGDAVHCPVEILEPELTFSADVDPKLAQRTRAHIEDELLRPDTVTVGPHFADLVFGRLLRGEGRSIWQFPTAQRRTVAGPAGA